MWRYRKRLGGVIYSSLEFNHNLRPGFFVNGGGYTKPILLHHHHRCPNPLVECATAFTSTFRYDFSALPYFCCSYSTSISGEGSDDCGLHGEGSGDDEDFEGHKRGLETNVEFDSGDLETIMEILRVCSTEGAAIVKNKLEHCCARVTSGLVVEVLSRVRNDWEVAFTFFLWAGKQPGYAHSVREYHSMIAILGKMRKFDTAWSLIDQMRVGGRNVNGNDNGPSLITPQTILIMIRRYCAVHDVGKAISTFYAYRKYKFEIRMEEFQNLLSSLCRYKNVKDAEHLLFCNKNEFPLNTKSFNIILNGWCNVVGDLREGTRIWKEMKSRGIPRDVFSFSSLMSCYSKYGRLQDVLKLFDRMKTMEIVPDRKVYNAVIHALAKAKHVKEARNLMKTMEENGITPDVVTYNSLIIPLCRKRQFVEAREVFDEMMAIADRGRILLPTARTYHAFLRISRTREEVFELLERMKKTGCDPGLDTYIMLIRKFCRWREIDIVFKLWNDMQMNGIDHDRSSYIVLIHGLFLNGKLEESYQYYLEMKRKHLLPEPKIEKMLEAWLDGKQNVKEQIPVLRERQEEHSQEINKFTNKSCKLHSSRSRRDFLRQPETRKVTRESGYSFLE